MSDPLPSPFVFVVLFDGEPMIPFKETEEVRDFLSDVLADESSLYRLMAAAQSGAMLKDVTDAFVEDWAKCFDFGDGDDRETILRPFPDFIRAFAGDKLVEEYRKAQEAA